MYQNVPFQGLPKYIKIGIFGFKKYHLATLGRENPSRESFRHAEIPAT
jgi:hypothetical protein